MWDTLRSGAVQNGGQKEESKGLLSPNNSQQACFADFGEVKHRQRLRLCFLKQSTQGQSRWHEVPGTPQGHCCHLLLEFPLFRNTTGTNPAQKCGMGKEPSLLPVPFSRAQPLCTFRQLKMAWGRERRDSFPLILWSCEELGPHCIYIVKKLQCLNGSRGGRDAVSSSVTHMLDMRNKNTFF